MVMVGGGEVQVDREPSARKLAAEAARIATNKFTRGVTNGFKVTPKAAYTVQQWHKVYKSAYPASESKCSLRQVIALAVVGSPWK